MHIEAMAELGTLRETKYFCFIMEEIILPPHPTHTHTHTTYSVQGMASSHLKPALFSYPHSLQYRNPPLNNVEEAIKKMEQLYHIPCRNISVARKAHDNQGTDTLPPAPDFDTSCRVHSPSDTRSISPLSSEESFLPYVYLLRQA